MKKILIALLIIWAIISFTILVSEDKSDFLSSQSMVIYYYSHGGEEIDITYLFDSESKERIAEAISERKIQFFRTNKNEDNILNCFFKISFYNRSILFELDSFDRIYSVNKKRFFKCEVAQLIYQSLSVRFLDDLEKNINHTDSY